MLAERMLGRGMAGKAGGSGELEARLEAGDTYRLPLGPTIAVVLVVFGIAAVVQLVVTATAG